MKTIVTTFFILLFSLLQSQVKKVDIVDFYNWTSNSGIKYQFILVSENLSKFDMPISAVIRVRYSTDGNITYKTAEFGANVVMNRDRRSEGELSVHINAAETASMVQGASGYSPDNFILYYDTEGNYLRGYQADYNELAKSDVGYAKVFHISAPTGDQMRGLIRLFYRSSDPLYRDLMTLAARYD
ncbi:hypothetical protein H1R16_08585 [Marnyiella aurantia]|uniref:Uncharacterized protein n=1 Tax=Marnyiella aurantia TaxID=2758037 RepID=A0A7D7LPH2_9FLAO|nr:hypothetical protein [Marnyiella aurantia]MBA5246882.1 hypothetical protein [Marnyiella aurantia]QMS97774.1 hypothetical protein H1R16_08585 [Marnyiella aurantia]